MTVKEGTICSLMQSFPVLLILAQNHQRCLKTPLMYKPPSPTPSPEYYEALDALFQNLYGHGSLGSHDSHGSHGSHGLDQGYVYQQPQPTLHACQYGHASYTQGKKWHTPGVSYGSSYGSKPCYQYVYTTGHKYHMYGTPYQGFPSYSSYKAVQGKKQNIYALNGNISSSGYAPNQVYNTKNRYQVVVKKTRIGGRKKSEKKSGKLQQGFFQERGNQNGFLGQVFQGPRRFRERVTGFFNNQQQRPQISNNNEDRVHTEQVAVEEVPQYPNQYDNYNGQNFGRPVVFPGNPNNGQNPNVNFQPPPENGNFQNGNGFNQNGQGEYNGYQNGQGDNNGYQNEDRQENDVKSNEDNAVPDNDPVNFDDTPPAPETTTLAALTPVPQTESRNSFNFRPQTPFQETCNTVEGGIGSCISVYTCQPYLAVIQESRTNPNAVQLLRRAHCGFEGTAPKVCCPRPGLPTVPPPTTTTTTTPAPTLAPTPRPKASSGDFVDALPEPPVCGTSNATFSRVVGGINAKLGDFPWMALLGYKNARSGGTSWLCGGSLISSRHVLTAAHCIHNHETDLYVIRLGELDLASETEGATPVDILIKKKIKHEQYSATAFTNDIGILVLENDAPYTDLIRPICIPKETELRARSFEDYNPMIAGWGHTEFRGPSATHLQVLQLPVVSNEFCSQAYSAYKAQQIDGRVLCAGYKQGGKDACQGDSGGPLMQPIYNQQTYKTFFYQIGVVSYGKKCAEAGFPGVYSRVTHFVPWIEEKVTGVLSA